MTPTPLKKCIENESKCTRMWYARNMQPGTGGIWQPVPRFVKEKKKITEGVSRVQQKNSLGGSVLSLPIIFLIILNFLSQFGVIGFKESPHSSILWISLAGLPQIFPGFSWSADLGETQGFCSISVSLLLSSFRFLCFSFRFLVVSVFFYS